MPYTPKTWELEKPVTPTKVPNSILKIWQFIFIDYYYYFSHIVLLKTNSKILVARNAKENQTKPQQTSRNTWHMPQKLGQRNTLGLNKGPNFILKLCHHDFINYYYFILQHCYIQIQIQKDWWHSMQETLDKAPSNICKTHLQIWQMRQDNN